MSSELDSALAAWRHAYGEIEVLGEDADLDPNTWTDVCTALAAAYDADPNLPLLATNTRVRLVGDERTWRVMYREDYLNLLGTPRAELTLIPFDAEEPRA